MWLPHNKTSPKGLELESNYELYGNSDAVIERAQEPICFPDLNLDLVIKSITASKQEYNLQLLYWTPLHTAETVCYRQQVFQDLENNLLMAHIKQFAQSMSVMRRYSAMIEKLDYEYHKKDWFLETAIMYCTALSTLASCLEGIPLKSAALATFRIYLADYCKSSAFQSLTADSQKTKQALAEIKYCVIIESGKFKVKRYEDEADYSIEVENTFSKFKQSDAQNYLTHIPVMTGTSHIEAKILEFVVKLFPEPFALLDGFCTEHNQFLDKTICAFDREIQFYIADQDFIAHLKQQGLPFCYPNIGIS